MAKARAKRKRAVKSEKPVQETRPDVEDVQEEALEEATKEIGGDQEPGPRKRRPNNPAGSGPKTPDALHAWLREEVEVDVPREPVIEGHAAPFDYLVHVYFEGRARRPAEELPDAEHPPRPHSVGPIDCVVWANRGGGKTFLGAVATMLDLMFKPGIEVRILGGTLEQSKRMHAYLRGLFRYPKLAKLVDGRITARRLKLLNGSEVEVLAQSHASVRGTRVQKLRCDEVELFDREVWEAAQLVTKSRQCGDIWVRGAVECLSTMHIPHGVMFSIVQEAGEGRRKLFRWGVVDVLGQCEPARRCRAGDGHSEQGHSEQGHSTHEGSAGAGGDVQLPQLPADLHVSCAAVSCGDVRSARDCPLLPECGGRAKERPGNAEGVGVGHLAIDDAAAMKSRVGPAAWESEMLCLRPTRDGAVLPEFDARVHIVRETPWAEGERGVSGVVWYGGMDFGMRAPTVVLWGAVDGDGVLWIVDEYSRAGALLDDHIAAMKARPWPKPRWIGVDPAGAAKSEQTGRSAIDVLRGEGFGVRATRGGVTSGLGLLRARLRPAAGTGPRLFVHARCVVLIESLERYHYPEDAPGDVNPKKDGPDHAVDALRYLVLNLDKQAGTLRQRV
ncbi:MAG: hypothetical protein IT436_00630 [Phycisphaerales bacterium]|nr:hypothetical protein [Phycisphaerales bacterium]